MMVSIDFLSCSLQKWWCRTATIFRFFDFLHVFSPCSDRIDKMTSLLVFSDKNALICSNLGAGVFHYRISRLLRHLRAPKQYNVSVSLLRPWFCMFSKILIVQHAVPHDFANRRSITIFVVFWILQIQAKWCFLQGVACTSVLCSSEKTFQCC